VGRKAFCEQRRKDKRDVKRKSEKEGQEKQIGRKEGGDRKEHEVKGGRK